MMWKEYFNIFLIVMFVIMTLLVTHYRLLYKKSRRQKRTSDTNRSALYLNITTQWVLNKQKGKSMKAFLERNNIHKVAIYGMGSMEELLYGELEELDITISYFIDKNAWNYAFMYDVITAEKITEKEEVDAIIVTPVFAMDAISRDLKKFTAAKVISLEELVFDME